MSPIGLPEDLDGFLDIVFASTPVFFVKEFLRTHKQGSRHVRIGTKVKEVRENLRDALLSKAIGRADVEKWFQEVEGWGKQHLYPLISPKKPLIQRHLLTERALRTFLEGKGFLEACPRPSSVAPSQHVLSELMVDDELARVTWRSHAIGLERREDLDEVRELDDGEYEFKAHRRLPRRSTSHLLVRKADGTLLVLVDLPLGDEHDAVRSAITGVAQVLLAPLSLKPMPLALILTSLDEGAVGSFGPRPKRQLDLVAAPTQARYRTDGARLEFKSTRASTGYTDSEPVRRVRKAMEVSRFVGEAGKFRLSFEGEHREAHDMIVSLSASENRVYLYSRMSEPEVLALVDQFLQLMQVT